jgi:hypothetical protein
MSSSRSIAAARNKRASEQQISRPNTSIASASVFSQQQRGPIQQQQPQLQQQQSFAKPKISVSDAIGLTTIRLCKVENFIKELSENGFATSNTQVIDTTVLTTLINRLDALEKKEISTNEQLKRLEKENIDLTDKLSDLTDKLSAFTKETNDRFDDFDLAFVEIEKQLPVEEENYSTTDTQTEEKIIVTMGNEKQHNEKNIVTMGNEISFMLEGTIGA